MLLEAGNWAGLVGKLSTGLVWYSSASSSAILALREAEERPPKTVAMIRSLPRLAEETRLKPAARV